MRNLRPTFLLIIAWVLGTTSSYSQKIAFPKENYSDSAKLAAAIPRLAEKARSIYPDEERFKYLVDMVHLNMASAQYDQAILYLDSTRLYLETERGISKDLVRAVNLPFEVFAKTHLSNHQLPKDKFLSAFDKNFEHAYMQLSNEAQAIAALFPRQPISFFESSFNDFIDKHQNTDSLTLSEATQLIQAFNNYKIYSRVLPVTKKIFAKAEEKTYVTERVMIKTRDGSEVQAVIVRKRELKEKLPAIFVFNIYADSVEDLTEARLYANANYAGIVANTRGKGNSPQSIEPFEHDAKDAYDVIDWISKQKWSNGKVGMVGGSYLGFAQWAAAKTLHPALKTIIP